MADAVRQLWQLQRLLVGRGDAHSLVLKPGEEPHVVSYSDGLIKSKGASPIDAEMLASLSRLPNVPSKGMPISRPGDVLVRSVEDLGEFLSPKDASGLRFRMAVTRSQSQMALRLSVTRAANGLAPTMAATAGTVTLAMPGADGKMGPQVPFPSAGEAVAAAAAMGREVLLVVTSPSRTLSRLAAESIASGLVLSGRNAVSVVGDPLFELPSSGGLAMRHEFPTDISDPLAPLVVDAGGIGMASVFHTDMPEAFDRDPEAIGILAGKTVVVATSGLRGCESLYRKYAGRTAVLDVQPARGRSAG